MSSVRCAYPQCLALAINKIKHYGQEISDGNDILCKLCFTNPNYRQPYVCNYHKSNTIYICEPLLFYYSFYWKNPDYINVMHIAHRDYNNMILLWQDKHNVIIRRKNYDEYATRICNNIFYTSKHITIGDYTYISFIRKLVNTNTYLSVIPKDIINIIRCFIQRSN